MEEEDQFIIYAGNEYNVVVPKDTGPEMTFDAENFGKITLKIDYISEYTIYRQREIVSFKELESYKKQLKKIKVIL